MSRHLFIILLLMIREKEAFLKNADIVMKKYALPMRHTIKRILRKKISEFDDSDFISKISEGRKLAESFNEDFFKEHREEMIRSYTESGFSEQTGIPLEDMLKLIDNDEFRQMIVQILKEFFIYE